MYRGVAFREGGIKRPRQNPGSLVGSCHVLCPACPRLIRRTKSKLSRTRAKGNDSPSSKRSDSISKVNGFEYKLEPLSEEEKAASDKADLQRTKSLGEDQWASIRENASKAFAQDEESSDDESALSADELRAKRSAVSRGRKKKREGLKYWSAKYKDFTNRLLYQYFNWRKDSWQDVQLFLMLNFLLLILGGIAKSSIIDALDGTFGANGVGHFWKDIYGILVVVFGQELPDATANLVDQVFSLAVALIGLGTFALVLALVEQVVLENLESNVRTGSKVFEKGHVLVLGWCENQRDEEVTWKVLSQLCQAFRTDGGRTIVVMSQRPKLQMEETFRRIIPEEQRFGCKFVFRAGSPLKPDDLRLVSAPEASAVVIVSDSSRSSQEADAQSIRAAVLLDELDFPGFGVPDPRTAHILVELKTENAVRILQYSTSNRVISLPTAQLNARRISRMVRSPVVGSIDSMLLSFNSASQLFVEAIPKMAGKNFGDLFKWFPDGIVIGLVNEISAEVKINPPPSTFVNASDELLILRPNGLPKNEYRASAKPAEAAVGEWTSQDYVRASFDESYMGKNSQFSRQLAMTGQAKWKGRRSNNVLEGHTKSGMFMLPLEYNTRSSTPEKVLILGWGEHSFMTMLLRELDRGPAALPRGSELTLFNSRSGLLGSIRDSAKLRNLSVLHVQGNALSQDEIKQKINVHKFKCVIVMVDQQWLDPDLDARNGIMMAKAKDMLRLDSMVMMAQLNVRELLEQGGFPEVNIICEKVAFEGVTRFEDRYRLPLGISVNMSAFAATFLAEAAYDPRILLPYSHLGEGQEVAIQDINAFAFEDEELSFWDLQARVASVGQVLYGTYIIPDDADQPIDIIINPIGDETRATRRIWNNGKSTRKVITMAPKVKPTMLKDPILTSPEIQKAAYLNNLETSMEEATR